jgi:hypothetical protein
MTGFSRWSVVAALVLLVVGVPLAWRAVPAEDEQVSATALLARIEAARDHPYSGYAESRGTLSLPVADRFTDLGTLFGGDTRMRVWWRSPSSWRVNQLLATGEKDVIRDEAMTTSWDYEDNEAEFGVEPDIRLPRAADLLPPALGRRLLDDVDRDDVTRIAPRRVAGRDGLGLRLVPGLPQSSIDHVDLWADRATAIPLRVEVYGARGGRPVLVSEFRALDPTMPDKSTTTFSPPAGAQVHFDDILDIADAADQYAPFVPPATLAGLPKSPSADRAVGVYGSGMTQLVAVPLWSRAANPLREQLLLTPGVRRLDEGVAIRVGPLGVLLTRSLGGIGQGWLVSGTVNDNALLAAARDVTAGAHLVIGQYP